MIQELGIAPEVGKEHDFVANIPQTLILLLGNIALFAGVMNIIKNMGHNERLADEALAEADDMMPALVGD